MSTPAVRFRLIDTVAIAAALHASSVLLPFAIDKLTGTGSSIEGFAQIGAGIGVDPTFFRYFVGVQELLVALGLAAALVAFMPWWRAVQRLARLGVQLAAPGLVATMIGALATEYFVRPGQQDWLVAIALRLIAIGVPLTVWTVLRFGWRPRL
ncbi:MAG: hypothetical protein JNL48_15435 [Acidobacteria bacterium]|nr:hypothetical protein [Acidobacteriota bacterium]